MSQDLSDLIGSRYDMVEITRKHRSGWLVGIIPTLTGGLNDQLPADLIADNETPNMVNLSFIGGRLRTDTGYISYADALLGVPKATYEHKTADGASTRLCITNNTVYKYDATADAWHVIKGLVSTTIDNDVQGGATALSVVSDADFTTGSVFALVLDDGTQMIRTVDSTGSDAIWFTPALPGSGVLATSGAAVILGAELNGDDENQIVIVPIPSHEWTVFTNGIDPPYRYEASADTIVTVASLSSATLAGTTVCKTLAVYKACLFLLNLVEAGTYRPYKYQWCKPGDPTDWDDTLAGSNNLLDSRDAIIAAKPIGSGLALYRTNSIVTVSYQGGSGDSFFRADTSIYGEMEGNQGVGVVSPNAVYALPDEAVIMTSDGIYLYRGGASIELISDSIFNGTFGAQGDMDGESLGQSFVHFADRTNEVFFFYRSIDATAFPDKALIFDLLTKKFRKRNFSDEITSAGDNTSTPTTATIDSLDGSIDEQTWTLAGSVIASGLGTILLGTVTAQQVMEYNYLAATDNGTLIGWLVETKDFDGVDRDVIMDWLEVEWGAAVGVVQYSTDSGQSWLQLGDGIRDTDFISRRSHVNKTAGKFRFRAVGQGGGGQIGKLSFKFKEASVAP